MELMIRRATQNDVATIAELNQRLAWESEATQLNEAVLLQGVASAVADPNRGVYFLAEHAGKVIGQTMITLEWSDWRNGWFWWIQSVYVREEARRMGVFRSMYQHILAEAAADPQVIGIRLYVDRGNDRAKATYAQLGLLPTAYELLELYPLPGRENHVQH